MQQTDEGTTISVRDVHFSNVLDVTDEGILICFKDKHPSKEWLPNDVTEEEIDTSSSDEHPKKSPSEI